MTSKRPLLFLKESPHTSDLVLNKFGFVGRIEVVTRSRGPDKDNN